jgi:nicotinamide riboside kinase
MKVINFIGASNTGKSTAVYGVLYLMKKLGLKVEYASEYAKDMVYEKRANIMADQLYILAKQNRRLSRLADCGIDYAVTDTCLLLGNVYSTPTDLPELRNVITAYFNQYDNTTFYLPVNDDFAFQKEGRVQQSAEESAAFVQKIEAVLPADTIRLVKAHDYVEPVLTHLGFTTLPFPFNMLQTIRALTFDLRDLSTDLSDLRHSLANYTG